MSERLVCMKCGSKLYPSALLVDRAEWESLRAELEQLRSKGVPGEL